MEFGDIQKLARQQHREIRPPRGFILLILIHPVLPLAEYVRGTRAAVGLEAMLLPSPLAAFIVVHPRRP